MENKIENVMLSQAKKLHHLGFALHWLRPRSKAPLENKWTSGERKDLNTLLSQYKKGMNLGVRLGEVSEIKEGKFLAVIDVDIKSKDKKHIKEAQDAVKKILGSRENDCPFVESGRGGGSRHYYFLTNEGFKTVTPFASSEVVKVHMPSKAPSKKELEELDGQEIEAGIRLSRAWEVSLYSEGRQVVLPPSIHPDSGKGYRWGKEYSNLKEELFVLDNIGGFLGDKNPLSKPSIATPTKKQATTTLENFEVKEVDLSWASVDDKIMEMLTKGVGVVDRSASLLPVCSAFLNAGYDKDEILSVLTCRDYVLGNVGYDHAGTDSRKKAAQWVYKYSLAKVIEDRDAANIFKDIPFVEGEEIGIDEIKKQEEKVQKDFKDNGEWEKYLVKDKNGEKILSSHHNCKTILENVCSKKDIVGYDEFSINDFYLVDAPWRSKKGEAVIDQDIIRIKFWCQENFGVVFGDHIIEQTLKEISDRNRFHPVRDWIKKLKWDGIERCSTWLKDYTNAFAPEPYLSDVSRKIICALVARVISPGIKFDHLTVIEGEQGKRKSSLLRTLVGDDWFTDAPLPIGEKDAVLNMHSKWLIEIGELSSLRRAELEAVKQFISQQTDRIRVPHGKRSQDFPRQNIMIGTTNNDEYLKDETGNRRYWPIKTRGNLDVEGIQKVREQLFAEAYFLFSTMEEPLYLENPLSEKQAKNEQRKREYVDEWVPSVKNIVEMKTFPKYFSMAEVASKLEHLGAHKMSPFDMQRVARCLKILGFEKKSIGKNRIKFWIKNDAKI